jgi:hypothetical protein
MSVPAASLRQQDAREVVGQSRTLPMFSRKNMGYADLFPAPVSPAADRVVESLPALCFDLA